jgi:hypothetical protein
MFHLPHPRAALLMLLVIPLAVTLTPSRGAAAPTAPPPCDAGAAGAARVPLSPGGGAAAATVAYLQAQARSVLGAAQARALAAHCVPGSPVVTRETTLAVGARRLAHDLGHTTTAVSCRVVIGKVRFSRACGTATVAARVVSLDTWTDRKGHRDTEGEALDHIVTLVQRRGRWLVARDSYSSDLTPRLLEAAGAPAAAVRAAASRLEMCARSLTPVEVTGAPLVDAPPPNAELPAGVRPGYVAKLSFDRAAAKAYADKYALSHNPTYTSFSADCANFGSQVMFAGGYPPFGDTYASGWWYDKHGTSSPGNDSYSHAWIAVANQQGAWNLKYTDIVSSIASVGAGDYVYYDWTGNGTWDHVAELVGTNSAGQKIVDAHTTDHYHVFWKLGTSATHYRFARTRATIVI